MMDYAVTLSFSGIGITLFRSAIKSVTAFQFTFVSLSSPHLTSQPHHHNRLHRYNPIIDLERFRLMVTEGRIPDDKFVTIQTGRLKRHSSTSKLQTAQDVIRFFGYYIHAQASLGLRKYVQHCRCSTEVSVCTRQTVCARV